MYYLYSALPVSELESEYSKYDLKRLELYSQNMVDYHLIMDLMPRTARLFFLNRIDVHLSVAQQVRWLTDKQWTTNKWWLEMTK